MPLIVLYAAVEGVFVGAISNYYNDRFGQGLVSTAVIATLSVFAAMFVGWKSGVIKVTERSRRIFGMALIGYLIFALVNVFASFMGVGGGWGFGGSGMLGIAISLFAVGLASYSLADRLRHHRPGRRRRRAGEVLLAARPRPDRQPGLALPRDAAPAGPDARLTCRARRTRRWRRTSSSSSSAWSTGGVSCRSTTRCASAGGARAGGPARDARPPGTAPRCRRTSARRVVMDQLTVVLYDASAAPGSDPAGLAADLAALRRELA